MRLAPLQRAFVAELQGRPGAVEATLSDARGLAVYRHAYRATLRAALADTFARTAEWVGEEAFEAHADAYVAATPSTGWTLADYGHTFPDHVAAALPDDPEVGELAWLEWALRRAFAAADTAPVDPATLSAIDWERATIALAPSVDARVIRGDVPAIWHAIAAGRAPHRVLSERPLGLLVWRAGLEPRFRATEPAEAVAVDGLRSGLSFAGVCASAAAQGIGAALAGAWLARWLGDGMIIAVAD